MQKLQWKIEHFFIMFIRHPKLYVWGLSVGLSGLFTVLEISEPFKKAIDNIPYVVGNDVLYTVVFSIILRLIIFLLSRLFSPFGIHPFEHIANYVDSNKLSPTLSSYVKRRLEESHTFNANNIGFLTYRVRKIKSSELNEFNLINRELFRYTTFGLPLFDIKKRNNALFKKNNTMFALVEANIDGQYLAIGLSHILVLNDLGKSLYVRNNGLADSEIRAEHIAKPEEWSNAIVMFSMGVLPAFRTYLKEKHLTLPYVFGDHLAILISEMRKFNPEQTSTFLYAQTEKSNGGIGKMFLNLGFEKTDMVTGDKCALWFKEIELPLESEKIEQLKLEKVIKADLSQKLGTKNKPPKKTP